MKSWKKWVALAGSAVMVLSVGGQTVVAGEKDVNLVFMDTMSSPEREAMFADLFAAYEEANPGVTVEYTTVPYEEAGKKLVAMNSAKTLPDIICGGGWSTLAHLGGLEPLTEYWNNYEYLDEMTPATDTYIRDLASLDGEIYNVPDGYILRGVFVRTDWMEEAGLNVEDYENMTWEQYFDLVKKLTDVENGRYGIAFRGGSMNLMAFREYCQSMLENGTVFLNDGTYNSIYTAPEALDYFKEMYGLYLDGYAPEESINWGYPEMVEGFVSGQCGTLIQTPEVVPICQEAMEDGTWKVLAYPRKDGAEKDVMAWGSSTSYEMSAYSENKEEAWNLIAYLTSPEVNLEYCKRFGCIPIYKTALEDDYFKNGVSRGFVDRLMSENMITAVDPIEIAQMDYFNTELSTAEIQKYLLGEQSAEDTIANLNNWLATEEEKVQTAE